MQERKLRRGRRRRTERVVVQMPVQLGGASETGQPFFENTETLTLSQGGASILSKRKLVPGQEIIMRRPDTRKEARIRAVAKIGDRPEGYVYAVEFLDPQVNLWEMKFASISDSEGTEDLVLLVCNCCQTSEAIGLKEPKLSDFEVAHEVLLYCSHCQAMTRWMQRIDEATTSSGQTGGD